MGAWDVGTFDNDTACDWGFELAETADTGLVASTLARALEAGGADLEAGVACEALAAAEVVARLRGRWGERNAYTETVDAWVEAHPAEPSPELVSQALAAIDRVLAEPSELLDLWSDGDDLASWRAAVADLRARVADPAAGGK